MIELYNGMGDTSRSTYIPQGKASPILVILTPRRKEVNACPRRSCTIIEDAQITRTQNNKGMGLNFGISSFIEIVFNSIHFIYTMYPIYITNSFCCINIFSEVPAGLCQYLFDF